ncbi:hypothetical protein D4R42_02600 [bacterium]|nr:MAG: hypothetical protein D4R42_02600 [bacterium]
MAGSTIVGYEWPHRSKVAVVSKNTVKDGIDFTTTNAYVSVTADAYVDIRGIPNGLIVITNEHATRVMLYQVWGKIGASGGEAVLLYTGAVGGADSEIETTSDGWDWVDILVMSALADNHVTGFVEVKGRAVS